MLTDKEIVQAAGWANLKVFKDHYFYVWEMRLEELRLVARAAEEKARGNHE